MSKTRGCKTCSSLKLGKIITAPSELRMVVITRFEDLSIGLIFKTKEPPNKR
jgi:hypothetical protein